MSGGSFYGDAVRCAAAAAPAVYGANKLLLHFAYDLSSPDHVLQDSKLVADLASITTTVRFRWWMKAGKTAPVFTPRRGWWE